VKMSLFSWVSFVLNTLISIEEGTYVRLLSRFVHTFGGKPSCYDDLRPYIGSLSDEEINQWRFILDDFPVDAVCIFIFSSLVLQL